jgi:hypothetical protein
LGREHNFLRGSKYKKRTLSQTVPKNAEAGLTVQDAS